jgi:hypothetical protein
MPLRYEINAPAVIGETLDGEAIIVNLDSGAYYSLREAGAVLWSMLESRPTQSEIVQSMGQQYAGDVAEMEAAISALLDQMAEEELVRPLDAPDYEPKLASTPPSPDCPPFSPPELEKFTDMADLLLLDPIHEVDEAVGWPQTR